jgi:hypothetical protein
MAEEYGYRTMGRKVQVTVCRHEGTVHPLRGGVLYLTSNLLRFVLDLYLVCTFDVPSRAGKRGLKF